MLRGCKLDVSTQLGASLANKDMTTGAAVAAVVSRVIAGDEVRDVEEKNSRITRVV